MKMTASIFVAYVPLVSLFMSHSAVAEFRRLVSAEGKAIKAELVSHDGKKVKIRREDGKVFEVDPTKFCRLDKDEIQAWMESTPADIDYQLRAGARKKTASKTSRTTNDYYEITLHNEGRDTIRGIRLLYRIIYIKSGEERIQEGEYLLDEDLGAERTLVLKSEALHLRINSNNGMIGCLIRVLDPNGELILDWVSTDAGMKDLTWETAKPKPCGDQGPAVEIR